MSWVSLSADGNSDKNDYKNVAKEAFSSPTTLSSRLGNRSPSQEGHSSGASVSSSRRGPSQINSPEEAESFHQMFNSTAVQVPNNKKHNKSLYKYNDKPTDLGNGLRALGTRVANRYYESMASTDPDGSSSAAAGHGGSTADTNHTFSLGSVERRTKDLDLSNNDNSFHVIGGLIVEFFQSKLKNSADGKIKLTAQDIAQLDRLAPHRVRASFVEAVRHRFTNAPVGSQNSIHVLARQCHELGLDAVYPQNPLLVANETDMEFNMMKQNASGDSAWSSHDDASPEKPIVETVTDEEEELATYNVASASAALTNLGTTPTNHKSNNQRRPAPENSNNNTTTETYLGRPPRPGGADPPADNETHSGASVGTRLTKMGVEMPYEKQQGSVPSRSGYSVQSEGGNNSKAPTEVGSTRGASPNLSTIQTDDTSSLPPTFSGEYGNISLAKRQLLAELQEAEGLMAESKTAEAAKFWRDHVQELQARLAALDGEGDSVVSGPNDQLLERVSHDNSEQRMMAEIMNGTLNYVPPNLNPFHGKAEDQDGTGSQTGQASVPETAGRQAPLGGIDPSLEGVPMVDVVAPADLPGGYNFEAEIEGRRFLATVPAGGVQKGETFSCYMRDLDQVGSDIPVGRWRDGVFDCLSLGLCHPVFWNALCCPLVLLGQIMTRVGFDFLGRPSLDNSINGPNTLWTILSFWAFVNVALFCAYNIKWSRGMELSGADLGALAFVNIAYALFVVYLASATRGSLREKYYIRESRFHDLEDCCCATFCLPFSLAQMARHTADYNEYEAVCCNDSGLPDTYDSGASGSKQKTNANSSPSRRVANKDIV